MDDIKVLEISDDVSLARLIINVVLIFLTIAILFKVAGGCIQFYDLEDVCYKKDDVANGN